MIKLEKFTNKYYNDLISWIVTEENLMQFAGPAYVYPLTKEQLDNSLKDINRYAFSVIDRNIHIGHGEIYLKDTSIHLGRILVGEKTKRGKGIGTEIVNKLLEFGFTHFDMTTAELNVFEFNTSAIACYKKVGFVITPNKSMKREIKNQVWTAINMTLTKEQWNANRK